MSKRVTVIDNLESYRKIDSFNERFIDFRTS